MRTREEQIDSLYYGHNRYSTITQDAFRNHLIEAERRAEQRVRAEIGRDSERLDWLDRACVHAYEPKKYFDGIGCGVCRVSHRPNEGRNLRKAIDAAREVG